MPANQIVLQITTKHANMHQKPYEHMLAGDIKKLPGDKSYSTMLKSVNDLILDGWRLIGPPILRSETYMWFLEKYVEPFATPC